MKGRLRERSLIANPFVVFADVTTALCFIFLVYALSTSQALVGITRLERQAKVKEQLKSAYLELYSEGKITDEIVGEAQVVRFFPSKTSTSKFAIEMRSNAGLQRISFYAPLFKKGQYEIFKKGQFKSYNEEQKTVLIHFGKVIASYNSYFTYLFLHGITERPEVANDIRRAEIVSTARASRVFDLLQQEGVIAPYEIGAKQKATSESVNPKNVVAFGTGFNLYTTGSKDVPVGRVDIVLFYNDTGQLSP